MLLTQPFAKAISWLASLAFLASVLIHINVPIRAVDIRHKKQAARLESLFESATASQSFVSKWRYIGDSLNNADRTLLSIGRRADLMIVGGILINCVLSAANDVVVLNV